MIRHCRITGCTTQITGRRTCLKHQRRIRMYGDPNFTQWSVADEHDVAVIIREQRPVIGLTRLERVLVAQGLTELGLPADEIARIVGVEPRTVYRWRSQGFRQAA